MNGEKIIQEQSPDKFPVGKKNIYTCHDCGHHIVTVDRDPGVTPFAKGCVALGCGGMMRSSMYRVFDESIRADYEWYRPGAAENLTPGELSHVERGGLLLRRVSNEQRV